jgi:aldehyde:ferredoxin oxidoreductase
MMAESFSAELKHSGYDKIIFRNKSPKWVYLWVNNDKVELRDASHLVGRGALETQDLIREELGQPKAQVAAIGIAGENRCFTASIEQSRSSASRLGGVLSWEQENQGKAVRGTKDINLARGEDFLQHLRGVDGNIKFRNANPIPDVMTICPE